MAQLSESGVMAAINKKIKGAKAKLGGDVELRRIINQAMGDMRLDSDLISAKRPGIPFLIYDGIQEFAAPSDIDYDKGITIIPEQLNLRNLHWDRVPLKYFFRPQNPIGEGIGTRGWLLNSSTDAQYSEIKNAYTFDFEDSSPYLMIQSSFSGLTKTEVAQTAEVSSTTGGEWVISSDATNVRKDTQNFKLNSSSVAFDSLGGATTVVLTNLTFTAVDLSNFEDKGVIHLMVYLPATAPDSISLRWGSGATAYWDKSVTERKNGLSFKQGWNLLEFDWNNVDTDTGSPDSSAVNYAQITITNSAATALKDYRIDGMFARLGRAARMEYYSRFLVISADGTRKEKFTTSSDTTVFEEQEVNQLIEKGFEIASEELREYKDADRAERKYNDRAKKLGDRFPSEVEIEGTTYHNI